MRFCIEEMIQLVIQYFKPDYWPSIWWFTPLSVCTFLNVLVEVHRPLVYLVFSGKSFLQLGVSWKFFDRALKSLVPPVAFRRPRPPCVARRLFSGNDITETDSVSDRTLLLQSLLQLQRQGGVHLNGDRFYTGLLDHDISFLSPPIRFMYLNLFFPAVFHCSDITVCMNELYSASVLY